MHPNNNSFLLLSLLSQFDPVEIAPFPSRIASGTIGDTRAVISHRNNSHTTIVLVAFVRPSIRTSLESPTSHFLPSLLHIKQRFRTNQSINQSITMARSRSVRLAQKAVLARKAARARSPSPAPAPVPAPAPPRAQSIGRRLCLRYAKYTS
jgi:hypothetical protein